MIKENRNNLYNQSRDPETLPHPPPDFRPGDLRFTDPCSGPERYIDILEHVQ